MPQQDFRARLQPKGSFNGVDKDLNVPTNDVLGPNHPSSILFPLWQTYGVLFPYTPSVATGNSVEYDPTSFIHSNYGYNAYVRSYPKPISISAEFTAQTNDEALYLLAVLWFFKSVTKSYFGINPYNKAGTPPPVLIFNYLGDYQFNNVPVVVKNFEYTYEADIDYVPVSTSLQSSYLGKQISLPQSSSNGYTYVPTHLKVGVELDVQYIPIQTRNEFNLDKFRQGKLMDKGFI